MGKGRVAILSFGNPAIFLREEDPWLSGPSSRRVRFYREGLLQTTILLSESYLEKTPDLLVELLIFKLVELRRENRPMAAIEGCPGMGTKEKRLRLRRRR